jgi:hypothetical protein
MSMADHSAASAVLASSGDIVGSLAALARLHSS